MSTVGDGYREVTYLCNVSMLLILIIYFCFFSFSLKKRWGDKHSANLKGHIVYAAADCSKIAI
jgi:hypothetical protein